jgi:hypothetical protein
MALDFYRFVIPPPPTPASMEAARKQSLHYSIRNIVKIPEKQEGQSFLLPQKTPARPRTVQLWMHICTRRPCSYARKQTQAGKVD